MNASCERLFRLCLLVGIGLLVEAGGAYAQSGPGGVGNAGGANSQPDNILWLDASDLEATNGEAISSWPDLSGNGHDFSQMTDGEQPIYRDGSDGINNQAVLDFDGDNDRIVDEDGENYIEGLEQITALFVVESDVSDVDKGVFTTKEPNDNMDAEMLGFRFDASGFHSNGEDVAKFVVQVDPSGPVNDNVETDVFAGSNDEVSIHSTDPRLFRVQWQSGGYANLKANGFQAQISDHTNEAGTGLPITGQLTSPGGSDVKNIIGEAPHNADPNWDGKIAEVILYGDTLNASQQRIVRSYLDAKYDFGAINGALYSHDGSHPGEVGGIGRTNSGDYHLEGASSVVALDAGSASTFSDGDFLMIGHDNAALSFSTNERPNGDIRSDGGSHVQKTAREWRADLTGASSQTVSVNVDLSELSLPGSYNDYALFVDDDGDFSNGATFHDLDSNGQASSVTIEDGQYLTVAAVKRTITFSSGSSSDFENEAGDEPGDSFEPSLEVELNYSNSNAISGISFSVSEQTETLVEDTDGSFDEGEDYHRTEDQFSFSANSTGPFDFNPNLSGSAGPALQIYNDELAANSHADEGNPEELDVTLDTGSLPSSLSPGSATTHTFSINDDDDPRKVSFSGGLAGKPIEIILSNPEEDVDTNGDNTSDAENEVTTLTFEVALPQGETGSSSTYATFEVTGGDIDDFDIPAKDSNNKLSDRKGEVQVNTTRQVDGEDTGYGTFDLTVNDDVLHEADETLTITLTTARSGTLDPAGDLDLSYTVLDDDTTPTVEFASVGDGDTEDVSSTSATLELSEAAGTDLDVAFTVAGTATGGGDDYTQNTSSPVTITAGNTQAAVTFSVADDDAQELTETIDVNIDYDNSDVDRPSPGDTTFTYSILDDDNIGPDGPGGVGDGDALQVWLRADDGTNQSTGNSPASNGDPVGEWVDQSPNGNDFIQSGTSRPSLTENALNGRSALTFTSSNNEVLSDSDGDDQYINGASAFSLFTVSQSTTSSYDAGVFLADAETLGDGAGTVEMRYRSTDNDLELNISTNSDEGGQQWFFTNNNITSTNPQILQADWDSGSDFSFYLDGNQEGSVGDPRGGQLYNSNGVFIGRSDTGSPYWDGEIAETIFYTQRLNQAQRQILQNYLSAKYDISFNTGGSAADLYTGDDGDGDPSTGGDYDRAMIGVGQASNGSLHGRARRDGLEFTAKNGLQNGDFVLAGHRVPSNSTTSDDAGGFDERSTRVWAFSWTDSNSDLSADVTFDLSDLGFQGLAGEASNYKLIVSTQDSTGSQGYSWGEAATANTTGDTEVTFSNVTLTDGSYYTLATTDSDASPLTNSTALVIEGTDGNEGNATATPSTYGGDAGYRMLGVPAEDVQSDELFSGTDDPLVEFGLPGGDMLYSWDDDVDGSPDGDWSANNSGTPLLSGRGFILFLFDDEGTDDADPIDPTLVVDVPDSKSTIGDANVTVGDGTPNGDDALNTAAEFHLLANPYTVPYDLTSLSNLNDSDFQQTVQIWDGGRSSTGSYENVTINTTEGESEMAPTGDVIAPWQGFFVQRSTVGSGPTSLTFNSDGRTSGSRSIIGSKSSGSSTQEAAKLQLRVEARNPGGELLALDKAASFYFHPDAETGWDSYDASKLFPLSSTYVTVAPLGTGEEGDIEPKALESRDFSAQEVETDLEFRASDDISGTIEISAPVWHNMPDDATVELIDTKSTSDTGDDVVTELTRDGEGYTFSYGRSKSKAAASPEKQQLRSEVGRPAPARSMHRAPRKMEKNEEDTSRFRLHIASDALPVELNGLDASVDKSDVVLEWETASETNNSGFYVEHRADSTASYEALGFVEGAETTTSPQTYRYRAEDLEYGRHEFRLRQVDVGGRASYSESVDVQLRLTEAFELSGPYPNPVQGRATMDLAVRKRQEVQAVMYDVLGRRIRTVLKDRELSPHDTHPIGVQAERLSSGVYFLRVQGENFSTVRRFTVLR